MARLNLRQVDVPEPEHRQDLEEDQGPLVVREHIARLEWAVGARYYGLLGQHDELGHVAQVVLDSVGKMFIP